MPGELTAKRRYVVKYLMSHKCSYAGCYKTFADAAELRRHKVEDPDHFFCADHELEFKDYADWRMHLTTSEEHNTCPSAMCANHIFTDLESMRLHILNEHKSAYATRCTGCRVQYNSPSALWGHLNTSQTPIVCNGAMNVNNAMAKFTENKKVYAWHDHVRATDCLKNDWSMWYSEGPEWFTKGLDANNDYVMPKSNTLPKTEANHQAESEKSQGSWDSTDTPGAWSEEVGTWIDAPSPWGHPEH